MSTISMHTVFKSLWPLINWITQHINWKIYSCFPKRPALNFQCWDVSSCNTLFHGQNWSFQQDSDPVHNAQTTQQWQETNVLDFIFTPDWRVCIFGFKGTSTSKVIGVHNEIMMDDYDGQMIFGELVGLKLPDIRLTDEEKPHPGNLSRPGIKPGPTAWEACMLHLFHSGGLQIGLLQVRT